MIKIPPELVPAPEMTAKQMLAYVEIARVHPRIESFSIHWKPEDLVPGYKITTSFDNWAVSYVTIIIEDDIDWGLFEDLRVEWEKEVTVAA